MTEYELYLPMPPTVNHLHGQRKGGGRYPKKYYVEYKEEVRKMVIYYDYPMINTICAYKLYLSFNTRYIQDIDNRLKALFDSITFDKKAPNKLYILQNDRLLRKCLGKNMVYNPKQESFVKLTLIPCKEPEVEEHTLPDILLQSITYLNTLKKGK